MRIQRTVRHALAHTLITAMLVLSGCPGEDGSEGGAANDRAIWHSDSVAIDFVLTGPVAQKVCERSLTRDELSEEQLDGLNSLMLRDAAVRAGCDSYSYALTVHSQDGSSAHYDATLPDCSATPIVPFDDFDAWARSTPCSRALQP